jgi:hypothetical protein
MRRHVAVTAMVALLVIGCNGENTPIPDRGPPRALPPNNGKESLRGVLPKPIGLISATEFQSVLDGIGSWVGGTKADRCTGAFLCGFGFSKVPVSIQPTFDAANANSNNVGANGTVLLQLKNLGHKETGGLGVYQLEAGKTYYVVVSSSGAGKARWDFVPFETGQTGKPTHSTGGGAFHSCGHKSAKKSEAAFYSCKGSEGHDADATSNFTKAAMDDFGVIGALIHFTELQQSFLEQAPGWVSCAFGCCTLEMSLT